MRKPERLRDAIDVLRCYYSFRDIFNWVPQPKPGFVKLEPRRWSDTLRRTQPGMGPRRYQGVRCVCSWFLGVSVDSQEGRRFFKQCEGRV
jgi:hypothetical protein